MNTAAIIDSFIEFKDDKNKLKALQDINLYIEEMEKMYQKAS